MNVDKGDEKAALDFTTQIDSMITVLDATHGENWDFDLKSNGSYVTNIALCVVIHYKEVNITNSRNENHVIKDLFVSFIIGQSSFTFVNEEEEEECFVFPIKSVSCTRGTLSYAEYFTGYIHSHTNSAQLNNHTNVFSTREFCLGSDTEIADLILGLTTEYSAELFELFLLTLTSVVSWESIEGVPYRYINAIKFASSNAPNSSIFRKDDMRETYNTVRLGLNNYNFNFLFSEGMYKIKKDEVFSKILHETSVANVVGERAMRRLFVIKSEDKLLGYVSSNLLTEREIKNKFLNPDLETPHTLIRDKKIEFNIEPCAVEAEDINKYHIHPQFIDYAAEHLKQELYKKTIRKHTVDRHHTSDYVRADIR